MSPGVVETGGGVWIRRKVFHQSVGIAFLLSMFYSDTTKWFFLSVLGMGLILSLVMEKRRLSVITWFLERYDKTVDVVPGQGPITFFTGTLIAWYLFGWEIAALGVIALAFGDPMAYVIGKSLGGPLDPWSDRKTLSGSLAFAVAPAVLISLIWNPVLGIMVGIAGALAESLPLPNGLLTDDNIIIPVVVAAAVWLVSSIFPSIL